MTVKLTDAEFNHLWRLVGWVRCSIGPSPEENADIVRFVHGQLDGQLSDQGRERLIETQRRAESVPKYVRAAVKALTKAMHEQQAMRPKKLPPAEVIEPLALPNNIKRKRS